VGRAVVRLKDIADRTGFSTNTVSLALRDSPRIPERTRNAIRAAAVELNYLPNQIAKSLVSRETRTIGLVLTDIMNPILTETAQALETALARLGYGILFATSNNNLDEETRVLDMFRSRQVDGMLIYPASHRELDHIRPLRAANYPVVLLVADPDSGIDTVSVDDRSGARSATAHLIAEGHTRIGIVESGTRRGNPEKLQGYQKALEDAGLPFDPGLHAVPPASTAIEGHAAMEKLAPRKTGCTALFCANDALAMGAMSWCRHHGIAVPGDLAIIGYDNIVYSAFTAPPLSTINYAAQTLADKAVARLMTLIAAGDDLPEPEITLIDPELVVRGSTRAQGRHR